MATKKKAATAVKKTKTEKAPKTTPEQRQHLHNQLKKLPFLSPAEREQWAEGIEKRGVTELPQLAQYDILPHTVPTFTSCEVTQELYDVRTNTWRASGAGSLYLHQILDTLAFAVMHGRLNSRSWVRTVFKDEEAFDWFVEELSTYEEQFRIRDPWWWALANLAEHETEESGFSTAEEMAQRVSDFARETGQVF